MDTHQMGQRPGSLVGDENPLDDAMGSPGDVLYSVLLRRLVRWDEGCLPSKTLCVIVQRDFGNFPM